MKKYTYTVKYYRSSTLTKTVEVEATDEAGARDVVSSMAFRRADELEYDDFEIKLEDSKMTAIYIECQACGGTGVYVGMGERGGAAVVCTSCAGSGKDTFEYKEFTGRNKREGVSRVYKRNYGYVLAPHPINFKGIGNVNMVREGVSYEEFLEGKVPEHIHALSCPLLADQGACHNIPGFTSECDTLNGDSLLGVSIKACDHYRHKEECWERFNQHKEV